MKIILFLLFLLSPAFSSGSAAASESISLAVVDNAESDSSENPLIDFMLNKYSNISERVKCILFQRFQEYWEKDSDSSSPSSSSTPQIARISTDPVFTLEERNKQVMYDLIVEASTEVLNEQQQELEELIREIDKKISKKDAACCAGVASIVTAMITAVVALTIHFTPQDCL